MSSSPVDAVFTWVDGDDPVHRAKRTAFAAESVQDAGSGTADTRFSDVGELRFAISLLRRHAPWLRWIHLVTDDQRPSWLTPSRAEALGVRLVSHTILFRGYEYCLPTFNSSSIEAMLDRIPDLAERFLYLNDDFFVIAPVGYSDYFTCEERARLRATWRWHNQALFAAQWFVRYLQANGDGVTGLVGRRSEQVDLGGWGFYALAHAPLPIYRSNLQECMEHYGRDRLTQYRFRSPAQPRPLSLYANRMMRAGEAVIGPQDWQYLEPKNPRWRWFHVFNSLGPLVPHLCVQSMDQMGDRDRARIFRLLGDFLADV